MGLGGLRRSREAALEERGVAKDGDYLHIQTHQLSAGYVLLVPNVDLGWLSDGSQTRHCVQVVLEQARPDSMVADAQRPLAPSRLDLLFPIVLEFVDVDRRRLIP